MLLNNRIMDDVLESPAVQVKGSFYSLILHNFVSKHEETYSVYLHVDATYIQVTWYLGNWYLLI
jgi:hypothetical protein